MGADISLAQLQREFDAVVLAAGCRSLVRLGVEGEDLAGVHHGLDLLRAARNGTPVQLAGQVVVIGGGNVAVDAAQVALRLGAVKATIISLEGENELPAFPEEVANARAEGVVFEHSWGPVRFVDEGGRVAGVELQSCLAVYDATGAFKPEFDACALKAVDADAVIVAVGQRREKSLFDGLADIDALTLRAGDTNLFVAGDCHTGPSSMVDAMAEGRQAAVSVNRLLAGEHLSYGRSYPGPVETEFEIDTARGSGRSAGDRHPVANLRGRVISVNWKTGWTTLRPNVRPGAAIPAARRSASIAPAGSACPARWNVPTTHCGSRFPICCADFRAV